MIIRNCTTKTLKRPVGGIFADNHKKKHNIDKHQCCKLPFAESSFS